MSIYEPSVSPFHELQMSMDNTARVSKQDAWYSKEDYMSYMYKKLSSGL